MYRYTVNNTITYTPDDLILFRESPFAVWMERLTLENPDHGIPPDLHGTEPPQESCPQDEIVITLRAEGRNVAKIDCALDEASRRTVTLEAMRDGADFIVDGVLGLGALSGNANLLMRTSGFSELGDYLYVPCETQVVNKQHSAFRLSFLADLLYSLQGQLPPQMLIISEDAEVQPLQTGDYIYYYRAVKKRFTRAMEQFRKHRMPDAAESAHFGRWSECASEVLKQRARSEAESDEEAQIQTQEAEEEEEEFEAQPLQVASASGAGQSGFAASGPSGSALLKTQGPAMEGASSTLAEQARQLTPGSYRHGAAPGHTPNLVLSGRSGPVAVMPDRRLPQDNRLSSNDALQDLQFIGSGAELSVGPKQPPQAADEVVSSAPSPAPAPAPSLRETPTPEQPVIDELRREQPAALPEIEPRAPVFLPPDEPKVQEPPAVHLKSPTPEADAAPGVDSGVSGVDLDSVPAPAQAPAVQRRAQGDFDRMDLSGPMVKPTEMRSPTETAEKAAEKEKTETLRPSVSPFSNSLITSQEFDKH